MYGGNETLAERGLKVFSHIYIDATVHPDEKYGYITKTDPYNPKMATVQIGTNRENLRQVRSVHMVGKNTFGFIREPVSESDFNIGDVVYVAADYSEKIGVINNFSDEIFDKAYVTLHHKMGGATLCWIKIEHLLSTGLSIQEPK